MAIGQYARGRVAIGRHCVGTGGVGDAEGVRFFNEWSWLLGQGSAVESHIVFGAWTFGVIAVVALLVAGVIGINYYLDGKAS